MGTMTDWTTRRQEIPLDFLAALSLQLLFL